MVALGVGEYSIENYSPKSSAFGTTAFTITNDSYLVWTLFFYATIFT